MAAGFLLPAKATEAVNINISRLLSFDFGEKGGREWNDNMDPS